MKPITITLTGKFIDGFLYLGRLFLVKSDGLVMSIYIDDLIGKLKNEPSIHILQLAFLRNDWLTNEQSKNLFRIDGFLSNFKKEWQKACEIDFYIDATTLETKAHFTIPDAPIFDIKAYGMRLYFGNRKGLFESIIESEKNEFSNLHQPKLIFDARTTFLSAKSGELMVSSNSDGLFRGRIGEFREKTKVKEKAEAAKSARTGWSTYDVINYESQSSFVYYKNEAEKSKNEKRVLYSKFDESSERKEIKNFGVEKFSQEEIIPTQLREKNIKYSFNSSSYCFFITDENILYRSSFIKDGTHDFHLSKRLSHDDFQEITTIKGSTKIISNALIPMGSIIETMSSVILNRKGEAPSLLHTKPVYSIKTFLSSRRFRHIILVFHEDGVSIHSLFPIDFVLLEQRDNTTIE